MKRKLILVCVAAILAITMSVTPGCYGASPLSSGVMGWHKGIEGDKWVKEAIFLPLFFFVLPFTSLIDYFILNAIDFWTDEPGVASSGPDTKTIIDGDSRLVMTRLEGEGGRQLEMKVFENDVLIEHCLLALSPDGTVERRDGDGTILATARYLPDGGVLVEGGETRTYSPDEVARGRPIAPGDGRRR